MTDQTPPPPTPHAALLQARLHINRALSWRQTHPERYEEERVRAVEMLELAKREEGER